MNRGIESTRRRANKFGLTRILAEALSYMMRLDTGHLMLTLLDVVDFQIEKSSSEGIDIMHDWNEPDRKGFDKLLATPLIYVEDILLIDTGRIDQGQVKECISKYGAVDAQKYFNHIHLLPRCNDIITQRQWAFELIDMFRRKVAAIDETSCLIGEVTFWVF